MDTDRLNVQKACAHDSEPRAGYLATYWVDAVSSVKAQMCLKDSTKGTYCTQFLEQMLGDATDQQDLLKSSPCSNYDVEMVNAWTEIPARCNLE
ncbi:hypothetical protein BDW68DRAFT_177509 [Aspergillus falconensis]